MSTSSSASDYTAITELQRHVWGAGDFNVLARGLMPLAEALVEAADPKPGQLVLDVACGSGNVALVAARRYAKTVGVDYVPALIARARQRAYAEGLAAEFELADAQALPFADAAFDVTLSSLGVMFAPDQERTASELLRVTRPGGTIALANWMPSSFGASLLGALYRYAPAPQALKPVTRWGTEQGLRELFGASNMLRVQVKRFRQYYLSVGHAVEVFSEYFGPIVRVREAADQTTRAVLAADLAVAFERHQCRGEPGLVLDCEYLEALVTR
jgi:ubiquinone/menaquinone biosynthesis C-methylase UbiE